MLNAPACSACAGSEVDICVTPNNGLLFVCCLASILQTLQYQLVWDLIIAIRLTHYQS
jgi:hypothetical protein